MSGVFQLKDNRDKCRECFSNSQISLILFKPDYTDDESDDHDNSEDESVEDGESTHQSEEDEEE